MTFVLAPTARQIVGNLTVLKDGTVLAGYRMGADRWDFIGDPAKESAISRHADTWATLVQDAARRPFHERVTTRPHPVQQWAARLDRRTPQPLPDVHKCGERLSRDQLDAGTCGCETWNRWLLRQQSRITVAGLDDKIVYRYFHVGRVHRLYDVRAAMLNLTHNGDTPTDKDFRTVLADERSVAAAVSAGWGGARMTERQQAFARMRSIAPGVMPRLPQGDGGWNEEALPMLADTVRWQEDPYDRYTTVHSFEGGRHTERAVQILTVARLNDLDYPHNGLEPWQTYAERAVTADGRPFPVEWSITGGLTPGNLLSGQAEYNLRVARNLERDYHEYNEVPPAHIEAGIGASKRTRDEITTGRTVDSARFVGTINAIVWAEAEYDDRGRMTKSAGEAVEEKGEALTRLYGGNALRMDLAVAYPQWTKLQETTVGEPRMRDAYQQQVRLPYLSAGMPTVSTVVGDGAGSYVAYTQGAARRAVFHDSHYATEGQGDKGRGQNMWLWVGTLGAGKTMSCGIAIVYPNVKRNTRVVFVDPSGAAADLATIYDIAPYSLVRDLADGKDGSANPPSMIRSPRRDEFPDGPDGEDDFIKAGKRASAERSSLARDMARRILPDDLYQNKVSRALLAQASRATTSWTRSNSLWDLWRWLQREREHTPLAGEIADALEERSIQPKFNVLFPPNYGEGWEPTDVEVADHIRLVVVCTQGLKQAPDNTGRDQWNDDEIAADTLIRLSAFEADRLLYGKPMSQRAVAIFDEAESMTDYGVGRGYMARLGRDHSKWNIEVHFLVKSISKNMLSGEIRNFLAGAWIGRIKDPDQAVELLPILNVTQKSYGSTLLKLSERQPGEFVHLDYDGRVGRIRVDDRAHHDGVREALLTNPTPDGVDGWQVQMEEVL